MAEVEEDVPEEEETTEETAEENSVSIAVPLPPRPVTVEETPATVSNNPLMRSISIAPRIHRDSGREVSELEPIDEQGERLDSTSLEGSTSVDSK